MPLLSRIALKLLVVGLGLTFYPCQAQSGREIDKAIRELTSRDPDVRKIAIRKLANKGVEARPALNSLATSVLEEPTSELRSMALEAISTIAASLGDQAEVRNLGRFLEPALGAEPNPDVRERIRTLCWKLNPEKGEDVDELFNQLRNASDESASLIADRINQALERQLADLYGRVSNDRFSLEIRSKEANRLYDLIRKTFPILANMRRRSAYFIVAKQSDRYIRGLRQSLNYTVSDRFDSDSQRRPDVQFHVDAVERLITDFLPDTLTQLCGLVASDLSLRQPAAAQQISQDASALIELCEALKTINYHGDLEPLRKAQARIQESHLENESRRLAASIGELQRIANHEESYASIIVGRGKRNPYLSATAVAITLFLALMVGLFLATPAKLVSIGERLESDLRINLPTWLGALPLGVPLRSVITIGLNKHPRALDHWVKCQLENARDNFERHSLVTKRRLHIPLNVTPKNEKIRKLDTAYIQEVFARPHSRLLIHGEGGTGKTSLACKIARMAMVHDKKSRLHQKHPMLPVLLVDNLPDDGPDLLKTIQHQLYGLIGARTPSLSLVKELLRRKRILLLVDGLSEFDKISRNSITAGLSEFEINAAIITSRKEESLDNLPKSSIKVNKIAGGDTRHFIERYIESTTEADELSLSIESTEITKAGVDLVRIAGEGGITALLAKIYADRIITAKQSKSDLTLAENIPDLYRDYINDINKKQFKESDVFNALELIAWECLKQTFSPMHAKRENVLRGLASKTRGEKLIEHLEDDLELIKTDELTDEIRFSLDPLAEHMASLFLVKENGGDYGRWHQFLSVIDARTRSSEFDDSDAGLESIKGFVFALRDCCHVKTAEYKIPLSFQDELNQRAIRITIVELVRSLSEDEETAKAAEQKLQAIGAPALPFLKKKAAAHPRTANLCERIASQVQRPRENGQRSA